MKYQVCEHCGAALDFGERCDCTKEEKNKKGEAETCQKKKQERQPCRASA